MVPGWFLFFQVGFMVFYCFRLVFRGFHGSMWVLCFFSVSGGFSLFFMVPGFLFMVPGGFSSAAINCQV